MFSKTMELEDEQQAHTMALEEKMEPGFDKLFPDQEPVISNYIFIV